MKHKHGLSLVELLVSMSILGILLGVLNTFFVSNQRVTGEQMKLSEVNGAARQSLLRINDVVSQAGYIFPAGQELTVGGVTFTTGTNTLAVLVPQGPGSVYCPGTGQAYCGYLYTVVSRDSFTNVLGVRNDTTGFALVEYKTNGATLTWGRNQRPTATAKTWAGVQVGVLTDSVNDSTTNLGGAANLELVSEDRVTSFENSSFTFADVSASTALIQSVTSTVGISYTYRGEEVSSLQTNHIFGRVIPRGTLPNPN